MMNEMKFFWPGVLVALMTDKMFKGCRMVMENTVRLLFSLVPDLEWTAGTNVENYMEADNPSFKNELIYLVFLC